MLRLRQNRRLRKMPDEVVSIVINSVFLHLRLQNGFTEVSAVFEYFHRSCIRGQYRCIKFAKFQNRESVVVISLSATVAMPLPQYSSATQ